MGNRMMELIRQRNQAVEQARALHEMAVDGKWPSTEEEEKYNKAWALVESLAEAIKREQNLTAAESQIVINAPAGRAVEVDAIACFQRELTNHSGNVRQALAAMPQEQRAVVEQKQIDGFNAYLGGNLGVLRQPETLAALNVTDASLGGYLQAPTVWVDRLIQALDNDVVIRRYATRYQTDSEGLGAVSLNTDIDDFSWTTEVPSSVSEDTAMRLGARELKPNPMAKLIKASKTLLRKTNAEQIVRQRLAYKVGVTEEKYFMTGNGTKQPLGLFTASSHGISTSYDVATGNTSATPTFDGLKEAFYTIKAPYRKNWLFHRDIVKLISKLKDGDSRYLWEPSVVVGQPDRIFNVPVIESEYAPNTISSGLYVGLIGDLSFYWVVDGTSVQVQRLVELYAGTRQDGFICDVECDGMPVLGEAFIRVKLG